MGSLWRKRSSESATPCASFCSAEINPMSCVAEPRPNLALTQVFRCPLCGGSQQKIITAYKRKSLRKCRQCSVCFLFPQPTISEVTTHFHHEAELPAAQLKREYENCRENVLSRVADYIHVRKPQGAILDVGCATGLFLKQFFRPPQWKAEAIELSPQKAKVAARNGIQVQIGDVHQARLEESSFDVVTILDAFYYFQDPHADLAEFRRILNDDGLLAIELTWANSRI